MLVYWVLEIGSNIKIRTRLRRVSSVAGAVAAKVGTVWGARAPPASAGARLTGTYEAQVAIVGAGIAGLSLALHLADRGVKAIVVEAEAEGSGATGRSGGLVVPYLS